MPPDRGRASRACASCRKQKTRCYEPGVPGKACLRCERLRQNCSLVEIEDRETDPIAPPSGTDVRLERLERTVATLLDRLGEGPASIGNDSNTPASALTSSEAGDPTPAAFKETESSAAPIMVIRDLATDPGLEPSPDTKSLGSVLDDLITPDLALTLISIFLEHYGDWIMWDPESDPVPLLPRVRNSPLLFCACCLIAVRYTSEELAASLAPKLYECARSLVSSTLLVAPQSLEFFQAALILCMWSTTVGQVPLSIDTWLLSGFALQHSQSNPLFAEITAQSPPSTRLDEKTASLGCLWNHLCLAHLHYCVGTSRRSMLRSWHIERTRLILDSDHATNFEVRMVAEIHLYWTLYRHLIEAPTDLLKSVADLQTWKKEWEFLLEQPRSQFLSMGFHFSNLILYEHALKSKSARGRDSVVSEMIRHSTAILHLPMDAVDQHTRHLSDHIYHMITFAAIVICRLLSSYETQLAATYAIAELDTLICNLVQWLHGIGLPCHAAYTLANIIAKVHQKLRPRVVEALPIAVPVDDFPEDSFTNYYFPEFLGLGASAGGNWDLLSDLNFFPRSPDNS
ncbi:hypothetical protein N7533_013080 [Penicillium manginii]|uniref:uncharacterized protein n=1 Tax=Penicillium manginii TaxID=203109 RepID=UPI002549A338|nr:uncharacterized protein N7533_013080 [Penicillium manginii]KAJ5734677.1 hypothetical protein N7533_013080 [Penicillium manginii]